MIFRGRTEKIGFLRRVARLWQIVRAAASESCGESGPMVFEQIEQLKRQYTDKYVVVDQQRPELRRFRGLTGQIKTVNMTGRALVQFDGNNNIGWYDINLEFLTVVAAPPPKEDKKAAARKSEKPVAEKASSAVSAATAPAPTEKAKPAVKTTDVSSVREPPASAGVNKPTEGPVAATVPSTAGIPAEPPLAETPATEPAPASEALVAKPSTADILAAARAKKAGGDAAATAAPPVVAVTSDATGQKPSPVKPSTADILAAARAKKVGGDTAAAATPGVAVTSDATGQKPPPTKPSTADILAAARAGTAGRTTGSPPRPAASVENPAATAKTDAAAQQPEPAQSKTADILAAARAGKAGGDAAKSTTVTTGPEAEEAAARPMPASTPATAKRTAAKRATRSDLPTQTAEILAYCRKTDGARGS